MQIKIPEEVTFICLLCGKKITSAQAILTSFGKIICQDCVQAKNNKKKIQKGTEDGSD